MKGVCVCVRARGRPSQLVARSDRALSAITAPGVSTTTISDNVVVAVATNTLVPLHLHRRGRAGGLASSGGGARMRKEGFWEAFSDCDISTKLWHARQSRLYVHVVVMHSDVSIDDGWTLLPPTFITVIGASSLRAKVGV